MNSIRCSQCEHYIEANAGEGKIYGCDRSKCVFEPTTQNDLRVEKIVDVLGSYTDLDIPYKHKIAEDILNNLPSVTPQEPRWIPVSERLPEIHQDVLLSLRSLDIEVGFRAETESYFYCHGDYIEHQNVLAWMPLPQAYREVEK